MTTQNRSIQSQASRVGLGRLGWNLGLGAVSGLFLVFMLLPIVALFATIGWSELWTGLAHPTVIPALKLTAKTTSMSLAVIVIMGTPFAWVISRRQGRSVRIVETLIRLPVVLPPAVAGVALLLAFGSNGLLGAQLAILGWKLPFTTAAVVVAEVFVAAPFFLQAAVRAFKNIDDSLLIVARTLGASPARVFCRVVLPMAMPSLVVGAAMAWARALGEFGATLMFAGNLEGETQTLTLAVYTTFESDMRAAQAVSLVLVAVAFCLLYALTRAAAKAEHD